MEMELMPQEHSVEPKKVTNIVLLLLILMSFSNFAQTVIKDTAPIYGGDTGFMNIRIDNNKLMRKKEDNFYILQYKFKISVNGKIDSILVNGTDDIELKEYFTMKIKETEKYWTPRTINGVPVDSKWFSWNIYIGAKKYSDTEAEEIKLRHSYPIIHTAYLLELKRFQEESEYTHFLYWETKTEYILRPWFLEGAVR
jgi:hypothetical protein